MKFSDVIGFILAFLLLQIMGHTLTEVLGRQSFLTSETNVVIAVGVMLLGAIREIRP